MVQCIRDVLAAVLNCINFFLESFEFEDDSPVLSTPRSCYWAVFLTLPSHYSAVLEATMQLLENFLELSTSQSKIYTYGVASKGESTGESRLPVLEAMEQRGGTFFPI